MNSLLKLPVRLLAWTVWYLPRPVHLAMGYVLGILWFDIFRIRRKVVLANLKLAFPEWTQAQRVRAGRASLVNMGRTLVEYLLMVHFTKDRIDEFFDFQGLDHLDRALRGGKGVLLLASHMGNGDFSVMATVHRGYKLSLISKRMKSKWLNDAWFGLRRRHGVEFIREEKSSFDILRTLKANIPVIFVLDQYMGPPSGVKTTFFGKETGTAQGLALFHGRTGAPVIPCYSYRQKNGKMMVVFDPEIPLVEKATNDETISFMTQRYTDKIEEIVRKHPGDWMWLHRRWKPFR